MNVLVIGGCGYIGSVLCEKLNLHGFNVTILDSEIFGNFLNKANFNFIKKDIRRINEVNLKKYHTIIHLANIANDPCVELNPSLSWDINVMASYNLINKAIKDGVKKIIFSSSGSVYGVRKEKKVNELISPTPLSIYNKTKIIAERIFLSFSDKIIVNCIRPATVCGYSKKMRLDLTVNALTYQALTKKKITVFGGKQIRPNIHVQDLSNVFLFFLKKNFKSDFYNAGFENLSVKEIAYRIQKKIKCKIITKNIIDARSYRLDSSKLIKLGFKKKYNINFAIDELEAMYLKGGIKNNPRFYSIDWLKKKKLK